MSIRSFASCAAAAFFVLCINGGSGAAAQNAVEANGPLSLPLNPPSLVSEAVPSEGDAATNAPQPLASKEGATSSQKALPPNEARSLGVPAKTPTPVRADPPSANAGDGFITKLDPRSNDITKVISALAIVVGLILMLRVCLRKSGGFLTSGGRPSGIVEILAKYPVGRGQSIVLLKVSRRVLLLHQTGSSMTTLSELTDPNEVAGLLSRMESGSTERDAERFRRTLTQFMAEHEPQQDALPRARRATMPLADTEVVDLTRTRRGFAAMLGRRSAG